MCGPYADLSTKAHKAQKEFPVPVDLRRVRKIVQTAAALKETAGDKEAVITITVPTPRNTARTLMIGAELHEVEEVTWDYESVVVARARPADEEIERARKEGRYQDQKPAFYNRFYNDNQLNPRIKTGRQIFLSSEAMPGAASTVEATTGKIGTLQRSNLGMRLTRDDRERIFPNSTSEDVELVIHETYPGEYRETLLRQRQRYADALCGIEMWEAEQDRVRGH